MNYEEIKNEIRKDFKKKSTIKRIQNNIDWLKDTSKTDYQKFYYVVEPSLCYYNVSNIELNEKDKNQILIQMFEETKELFNY